MKLSTRTAALFSAPFILLLLLAAPGALGATPNDAKRLPWRSMGPAPGAVEAAVQSDPASGTIYIGSLGGGIYRSTDNGAHFMPVNTGLDALTVGAIVMAPGQPQVLYASTLTGVFKTVDGGLHWVDTAGPTGVVTFAMDPSNPDVIYTGSSPNGGVHKTLDGGATWTAATTGLGVPPVFSLAINPANPQELYAGTAGVGAFRSSDGGATWAPLAIDTTVWSLLVDPVNTHVVYAGTNGNGVYVSTDGGTTFARMGGPATGVVLAMVRAGRMLYAGTASAGLAVSGDGGLTWRTTELSTGLVLALSVDTAGTVYAGTNFQGVFRHASRERDADSWRRVGWDVLSRCACQNGHAIAIDPANSNHVLMSTNDGGLMASLDGGRSWFDGGTRGLVSRAPRGIAFDPQDSRHVYTGGFTGMGFFKSDDGGRHWQRRFFGSGSDYSTGIAVDPVTHAVYVATLNGDGVWKSTDFGDTFVRVDQAAGAAPGSYLGLAGRGISVANLASGVVFVAASRGKSAGIWRSVDAGATWSRVDPTPTLSVTVDPTNASIVYAATPGPAVLKSVDGGATFVPKSAGLTAITQTARTGSVQVDPRHPSVLFVATEGDGVFRSDDGAETWAPVNLGLNSTYVFGLAMDPRSPGTLYAATDASVFKTTSGGR